MNKLLFIFGVCVWWGCGGSLTDEQRKKMKEASEQQAIVKVTDAEITEAAFEKGRSIASALDSNSATDSINISAGIRVHWLEPGASGAQGIEQQLIDAYINSVVEGVPVKDNVQEVGLDSLLYTQAVVLMKADSSVELKGIWNIWMLKKQLIVSITKD